MAVRNLTSHVASALGCVCERERERRGEERREKGEKKGLKKRGEAEMAKAGGWELLPQGFPSTSPTFHHSAKPGSKRALGKSLCDLIKVKEIRE